MIEISANCHDDRNGLLVHGSHVTGDWQLLARDDCKHLLIERRSELRTAEISRVGWGNESSVNLIRSVKVCKNQSSTESKLKDL